MLISPPSGRGAGFLMWLGFASMVALSAACGQRPQAGAAAEPTPQAAASPAPPVPWQTIEPPTQVVAPAGTPEVGPRAPVMTYSGTGVVRLVNLGEGWLEIDHEEIAGFMPAMQMEWSVKDRRLLKSVRAGDKVDFTVEDDNGNEVITDLKKSRAAR